MIIRSKTFKTWLLANFTQGELKDLYTHGADTGWQGLTWYSDTVKLFERFKEEIFDRLYEESCGDIGNILGEMLSLHPVNDYTQFANLLTWYMAESLAREICEKDELCV